jgi:uncharacterized protein YggE
MSRSGFALALALALAATAGPARGQIIQQGPGGPGAQNIEGLTVAGKGSVKARPDRFEIDLDVSAASELSADAIVKYRDAKKRLADAFANLKLDNVEVVEEGLLVDQKNAMQNPYYYNYGAAPAGKAEVQLSRRLVVKCSKIRGMEEEAVVQLVAKLLDVAQDAGGQVGSQNMNMPYYYYYNYGYPQAGLVRFVLDDFEAQEEKAYEEAVADARRRAERLARLGGVELGPVVAIREVVVPGEGQVPSSGNSIGAQPSDEDESDSKRLVSSKFEEIPIRVELLVRFEVHPKGKAGGQ